MIAILLAAGAGRRLGGCKALLELGGVTALERCLAALRDGGAGRLRVVLGHQAAEVAAAVDLSACEVLLNPAPERGQTSSLRAGLLGLDPLRLPGGGLLLHTVDAPLVRAAEVAALLAAWEDRAPQVAIVVPSVAGRRGHPVVFGAAAVAELQALPDDAPAHSVLRRDASRVLHLPCASPWLLRDLDTPADLEDARAELARRAAAG